MPRTRATGQATRIRASRDNEQRIGTHDKNDPAMKRESLGSVQHRIPTVRLVRDPETPSPTASNPAPELATLSPRFSPLPNIHLHSSQMFSYLFVFKAVSIWCLTLYDPFP